MHLLLALCLWFSWTTTHSGGDWESAQEKGQLLLALCVAGAQGIHCGVKPSPSPQVQLVSASFRVSFGPTEASDCWMTT